MTRFSKQILFLTLLSGIVFGYCASLYFGSTKEAETKAVPEKGHVTVLFKNVSVNAELADTEISRTRGLSGRSSLKEGEGMWFAFEVPAHHSFWMKEMNFPIDILWFNEYLQLVYVKENATPESYPDAFTPTSPEKFVLEVPSGFVKKYEISLGDKIAVNNTP